MKVARHTPRSGYTLLELMATLTLIGIVFYKVTMVVSSCNELAGTESSSMALEDRARRVLDRIALVIMSSDREALTPILTPEHSTGLRFQRALGIEDGATIWTDPEEIVLGGPDLDQVLWRENVGLPSERDVVWSSDVLPLLEGEAVNGVDDNGNGLVDEEGLSFVVDRNRVIIRISLGQRVENGELIAHTVQTIVTCRNNPVN